MDSTEAVRTGDAPSARAPASANGVVTLRWESISACPRARRAAEQGGVELRQSQIQLNDASGLDLVGDQSSRRRDCHSAAPPSPYIRCFNSDEEGSSK